MDRHGAPGAREDVPFAPLVLHGRTAAAEPVRAVRFDVPVLLAPMDGVTDRTFRDLLIDLGDVGGACTEFLRVSVDAVPLKVFRRELGVPPARRVPVGAQIMAPDGEHVAETVRNADRAGASWIDLNFGCPVKRVFNKCAGSALLAFPERLGAIVAAAVGATTLPVVAKIRAGVTDEAPLPDVLDAIVGAGAAGVTLHARLRSHSYAEPARWGWIAAAADRLRRAPRRVPLIGNGGVDAAPDVARMFRETGCDAVMIGRAAIADPWVFREARGGPPATRGESLAFLLRYLDLLCPSGLPDERTAGALNQAKRFVAVWRAGALFDGREDLRAALLRERRASAFRTALASLG